MPRLRIVDPRRTSEPAWSSYIPERLVEDDPTVADLVPIYLQEKQGLRSVDAYRATLEAHVLPSLGPYRVKEVSVDFASGWFRWIADQTGLSSSRLDQILTVARGAFDVAVPAVIEINPFRQIDRRRLKIADSPPTIDTEEQVLSVDDASRLVSTRELPLERRALYATAIYAGLRPGELLGLWWGDLRDDRPLRRLVVSRQWRQEKKRYGPRKGGEPTRVPIHPDLSELLSCWRIAWGYRFGRAPTETDPVFVQEKRGELVPLNPETVRERYRRDLVTARIVPQDQRWRLHGLRHTFLTLTVAAGANADAIFACTHKPSRSIRETYRHWQWPTLCEAISLHPVRLHRPPHQTVLPIELGPRVPVEPEPMPPRRRGGRRRRRVEQLELIGGRK